MALKKWHEIYDGTSDEYNFFVGKNRKSGLVRSSYAWRSTASLAKESGLTVERCENIIDKYMKLGIVVSHASKEDHFGYWANVAQNLGTPGGTIAQVDQANRVKKATAKKP